METTTTAAEKAMDPWFFPHAVCERVVDGDTVDILMDLGFKVSTRQRVRLYGVDAPEVRGSDREAGLAAKEWLRSELEGKKVVLESIKDKYYDLYGRYLGKIWYHKEGTKSWVLVNQEIVKAGHAVVRFW